MMTMKAFGIEMCTLRETDIPTMRPERADATTAEEVTHL
jgi:hypothetical protein